MALLGAKACAKRENRGMNKSRTLTSKNVWSKEADRLTHNLNIKYSLELWQRQPTVKKQLLHARPSFMCFLYE